MFRRFFFVFSLLIVASMVLAACGGSSAATPVATEETVIVTAAAAATTAPPTQTPKPTFTPNVTPTVALVVGDPNFYENWGGDLTIGSDMGMQIFAVRTAGDFTDVYAAPRSYTLIFKALTDKQSVEQYILPTDDMLVAADWVRQQFPDTNWYWAGLTAYAIEGLEDFSLSLPENVKISKVPATKWSSERAKAATYDRDPIDVLEMLAKGETTLVSSKFDAIELYVVCKPFAKGEQPAEDAVPEGINPQQPYKLEIGMVSEKALNLTAICPKGVQSSWGWRHYAKDIGRIDRLSHAQRLNNALLESFFSHFNGDGKATPGKTLLQNNSGGMFNLAWVIVSDQATGPLQLAPASWFSN